MSAVDRIAAEKRRDRIKALLDTITNRTGKLLDLVEEAKANNDHQTLGWSSWTAYVAGEFRDRLVALDRVQRREAVEALSLTGMSTRAIASVVGVSQQVVHNDIQVTKNLSPDVRASQVTSPVTGMDGKTYPARQPRKAPRRRPISDQYRDAVYELQKAADRLQRLHDDDRFAGAREAIVWGERARLARPVEQLQQLLDQLNRTPAPLPIEGVVQ